MTQGGHSIMRPHRSGSAVVGPFASRRLHPRAFAYAGVVSLLLGGARPGSADTFEPCGVSESTRRIVSAYAESVVEAHVLPCMVVGLLAADGNTCVLAWGDANRGLSVRAAPETVFPTASLLKPMTAVGLLSAIRPEIGTLDLDRTVSDLLPPIGPNRGAVDRVLSVRNVLSHDVSTAGGPGADMKGVWEYPRFPASLQEVLPRSVAVNTGEPGYNNDAYLLAGYALGTLETQRLQGGRPCHKGITYRCVNGALIYHVWDPLGMHSTRLLVTGSMVERMAVTYRDDQTTLSPVPPSCAVGAPAMGAFTTARDLLTFLRAAVNGGVVSSDLHVAAEAVAAAATPAERQPPDIDTALPLPRRFGHGWMCSALTTRPHVIWHGGDGAHFTGVMIADGDRKTGACLLTPSWGVDPDALQEALVRLGLLSLDALDGLAEDPRASAPSGEVAAALIGTFANPANPLDVAEIRARDGLLELRLPHAHEVLPLFMDSPWGDKAVVLRRTGAGARHRLTFRTTPVPIDEIAVSGPRPGGPWRRRLKAPPPQSLSSVAGFHRGEHRTPFPVRSDGDPAKTPREVEVQPIELDIDPAAEAFSDGALLPGGLTADRTVLLSLPGRPLGGQPAKIVSFDGRLLALEVAARPAGREPIELLLRVEGDGGDVRLVGVMRQGIREDTVTLSREKARPAPGRMSGLWQGRLENRKGIGPRVTYDAKNGGFRRGGSDDKELAAKESWSRLSEEWRGKVGHFVLKNDQSAGPALVLIGRLEGTVWRGLAYSGDGSSALVLEPVP